MSAWVMPLLQGQLERAVFRCTRFDYASAPAPLDHNSERLAEFVQLRDAAFNRVEYDDAGGSSVTSMREFWFTALDLPAGTYHLEVFGETDVVGGRHIGSFDITPVPEPGTWAMLLTGLGVVSLAAARKRKA